MRDKFIENDKPKNAVKARKFLMRCAVFAENGLEASDHQKKIES